MGKIGGSLEYEGQRRTGKEKYPWTYLRARAHTHTHTHTHTQIVQEPYLVYKGKGPNYAREIQQKNQGKVCQ